jgi:CP family cyanate transporter-like MFS transporter
VSRVEPRAQRAPVAIALGFAVMLLAINLRPAVASVGPLLHRIEAGEGLSNAGVTALTTLPVLCFGLFAPASPLLARRLGIHAAAAASSSLLLVGLLIRLVTGVGFLFLGTALAGSAIAVSNVLMPVMVRRDFTAHAGTAMSIFTAGLIGFAALAAGVTVPVADALGGGWRPGLAIWALPAAVAMLIWLPVLIRRRSPAATDAPPPAPAEPRPRDLRRLLRNPLAWQVTLFFAVQSGGFYATLSWLPSIFRSHGYSDAHAGALLSVSLIVGIFTGLTVPSVAGRLRDQRSLVIAACLLSALGWIGILAAPTSAAYLWVVILGLGQQASFPLILMLIVLRGGSVRTTQALSAMAQSVGYGLAALAPLAVGAIHGLTDSWTPVEMLLLLMVIPQLLLGLGAGRPRQISPPDPAALPGPRAPVPSEAG